METTHRQGYLRTKHQYITYGLFQKIILYILLYETNFVSRYVKYQAVIVLQLKIFGKTISKLSLV